MLLEQILSSPMTGLIFIIAILITISVHEFAHAWAATLLGDSTPQDDGRLTLNPLAHVDWLGLFVLMIAGFGWGRPVVFNPMNFKNLKRDSGLVAIAGPLSNLVFAILVSLLFKFILFVGISQDTLVYPFLVSLLYINLILMLFNLIPLPPLDGSKILFSVLPNSLSYIAESLERAGPMILLMLLIINAFLPVSIFGFLFYGVNFIMDWLV